MRTLSVNIENLCAPCHCSCRHCLLSSQHCITGVDYQRGETFSRKFYGWMKQNRPDLSGFFYVGYSMDFPQLPQYVSYMKEQTGMTHLLFDGLKMRSREEVQKLLSTIQAAGSRQIALTFYGLESYHDRFAGRKGDFRYLISLAETAFELGLSVNAWIMLTRENMDQMVELLSRLESIGIRKPALILPHSKGRGRMLSNLRMTEADFNMLPPNVQSSFSRHLYKTEAQWLQATTFPRADSRHLTLSLTTENIDRLERMSPAEIIRELEELDDAYYAELPSIEQLAQNYGQPDNRQLFRFRDLVLEWQMRYRKEHAMQSADVQDERYSFSTRIYAE